MSMSRASPLRKTYPSAAQPPYGGQASAINSGDTVVANFTPAGDAYVVKLNSTGSQIL